MNIKVIRSVFTPTATLGKMFINDEFFAFTLEDTNRDLNGDCTRKVQNNTCIDPGTYNVVVSHSNHFNKDLPEIQDVPCFAGIRIHGGNTNADTEGCILIGAQSNMTDKIWECAARVADLTARIQGLDFTFEQATIEIVNEAAA